MLEHPFAKVLIELTTSGAHGVDMPHNTHDMGCSTVKHTHTLIYIYIYM